MIGNLRTFDYRYNYNQWKQTLDKDGIDALEIVEKWVDEEINKLPINKKFEIQFAVKLFNSKEVEKLPKRALSNTIIGHFLVANEKIEWDNCGCGSLGKFIRRF